MSVKNLFAMLKYTSHFTLKTNMKKMLKNIFLFLCLIFLSLFFGQNKTFVYSFSYKPNVLEEKLDVQNMYLDLDDNVSIFRDESDRKTDSLMALNRFGYPSSSRFENQFYLIKKRTENTMYKSIQNIFREKFLIKIDEDLKWIIIPEINRIGNFDVQKATVNYGGRKWIAWFTKDIPIQEGPYVFGGLPGLIVKIEDDQKNFIFDLIEILNFKDKLHYRSKGTDLSWDDFKKLCLNYYADPMSRIKSMNIPYKRDDGSGNYISLNLNDESRTMQKIIRDNNNPVEISHKIDYK